MLGWIGLHVECTWLSVELDQKMYRR
jgi:hypothetical protein